MATKVLMEALSPTMEEGKVLTWHKAEGDQVTQGEVIAEVETDKAVMELQARAAGVLRKILAPAGATVQVGSVLAVIAGADEKIDERADGRTEDGQTEGWKDGKTEDGQTKGRKDGRTEGVRAGGSAVAVARAAPSESALLARGTVPAITSAAGAHAAARVKSSPLARRIARERGLDLAALAGSGPGGRIIKRDVEAAQAPSVLPSFRPSVGEVAGGWEDVELSQTRKTIAKRLVQSIGPIPHFFLTAEIDMERVAEAREQLNALEDGPRISYNDIVLKVAAMALMLHRDCNAWWQESSVRYFNEVHLGMAVATDAGLITPVIRNAERKSLRQIAAEARELAERARARKLRPEEYTGSTFSVSNLGMFDIDQFTAVINPPEAGILAVGSVAEKPVAMDGAVTARKRMRVTMSCDHRVIDGAAGARFLQTVKRMIENPLAIVW
jgi:pyruvate dehydrogenase E2 component (dihydrolipoamide acetyltransferase)